SEHRQVGDEIQGDQREDRPANRFRIVDRASAGTYHRRCDLLHRLPVPAVGRQEADTRRQDHVDDLCACRTGGAEPAAVATAVTRAHRKALTPVSASPMTSWCTSDVPS